MIQNQSGRKCLCGLRTQLSKFENIAGICQNEHPDGRVIVVLGSPGNKAISRRHDFGKVLSETADVAF